MSDQAQESAPQAQESSPADIDSMSMYDAVDFKINQLHKDMAAIKDNSEPVVPTSEPVVAVSEPVVSDEAPAEQPTENVGQSEASVEEPKPVEPVGSLGVDGKIQFKSDKFVEAAKREREERARREAIEQREAELQERLKKFEDAKTPLDYLKAKGLSYEDVVSQVMGTEQKPAEEIDPVDAKLNPVQQEIKAIQEELKATKEALEQEKISKSQQEQEKAIENFNKELSDFAKEKGYEYVQAFGNQALEHAQAVWADYYNQTGKFLDYGSTLDIVEEHYEKEYLERMFKTSKFKGLVKSRAEELGLTLGASESKTVPQPQETAPKTLTSSHSVPSNKSEPNLDDLDMRDAMELLIKKRLQS